VKKQIGTSYIATNLAIGWDSWSSIGSGSK